MIKVKSPARFCYSCRAFLFCSEKHGPLGQVRDKWLCPEVLCLKKERRTPVRLASESVAGRSNPGDSQSLILWARILYFLYPTYKTAIPNASFFHLMFLNPASRIVAANKDGIGKFLTEDGRY